jgi:predicted phage terminase large subunit-like protein
MSTNVQNHPTSKLKLDLRLIDQSLARDSFADFVKQAWHIVEPATPLCWNWHLDVICEYLEALALGDGVAQLIINLPPRSGKSLPVSVLWPAWVWIKLPSTRWVFTSYAISLSAKHSADRRTVITSPWYQRRWPLQLSGDQNQKTEFVNTVRGHMLATSVGGAVTGKGGDIIVADDLQNPEMAESQTERETGLRYFDETLSIRLDPNQRRAIVVIQQRIHQADLSGHLLERGGWTHLCLPAEFDRRTIISLPISKRELVKEEGDMLWPHRMGRTELDAIKRRLGSYGHACQYLQNPVARGGNVIKESWFGTFREFPKFDQVVQSWDCSYKTGQTNDYSACVTVGVIGKRHDDSGAAPGYYVLHAWRDKVEFVQLKRKANDLYREWNPEVVLIEDTASGQSLLQELRTDTVLPIKGRRPDGDKYSRTVAVTPAIEGGRFFLRDGSSWLNEYKAELIAFPGGAHDDYVDATVQALNYLREPGIITHQRDLAAAERARFALGPEAQERLNRLHPNISDYELKRRQLDVGFCHDCNVNLFMNGTRRNDGPHWLCEDCWKKKNS